MRVFMRRECSPNVGQIKAVVSPPLVWTFIQTAGMGTRKALAANLQAIKTRLGLSNIALAKKTGVSNGTIGRALLGTVAVDVDSLDKIAAGLGVTPSSLVARYPEQRVDDRVTKLTREDIELLANMRVLRETRQALLRAQIADEADVIRSDHAKMSPPRGVSGPKERQAG
jgi:transcriptional regulator with XRE-family HTH domain